MGKPSKAEIEELEFLKKQEWELVREIARDDLWYFINTVLFPKEAHLHYQESFHKPLCDDISSSLPGTRNLLLAPRMSRKTMIRSISHAIWRIVRDLDVRILLVSALDATATDFVDLVKRQLQQNESLRTYFPEACLPQGKFGTTYEFTHPGRKALGLADPTLRATYLGAPFVGRRADIAILDDIIDDKHVSTPEQADKALKWFNAIEPLIDRNGRYNMCFIQGTRKAFNDVYGAILGESRGEEANVGHEGSAYQCKVISALEDEEGNPDINGEPVFPLVLSRPVLMQFLEQARINPQEGEAWWWQEMMNVIGDPTSRKFLPEWLDTWTPVLPSTIVWSGIAMDTAVKDKQLIKGHGDFTVVLLGHLDAHGHLYLTDGARSNTWRWADLSRELIVMSQRSGVSNLIREKVGEEVFFGAIQTAFHQARLPCTTYPLSVRQEGKKVVRIIEALQGPCQARKIHFVGDPHAGTGFPKALQVVLTDELSHLGQWQHDDAADCLSLFYHKSIRVIPSSNRSVPWTPMTHARIPQASTPSFNPSAMRQRPPVGDGSIRPGGDPFVAQILEGMAADNPQFKPGRPPVIPFPVGKGGVDDVW